MWVGGTLCELEATPSTSPLTSTAHRHRGRCSYSTARPLAAGTTGSSLRATTDPRRVARVDRRRHANVRAHHRRRAASAALRARTACRGARSYATSRTCRAARRRRADAAAPPRAGRSPTAPTSPTSTSGSARSRRSRRRPSARWPSAVPTPPPAPARVWQVRARWPSTVPAATSTCDSDLSRLDGRAGRASSGTLAARAERSTRRRSPTSARRRPAGGFRGLENQLYRVQIHDVTGRRVDPVTRGARDNGSSSPSWTATVGDDRAPVARHRHGRRARLRRPASGSSSIDDGPELADARARWPLLEAQGTTLSSTPPRPPAGSTTPTSARRRPKVRRWDSAGPHRSSLRHLDRRSSTACRSGSTPVARIRRGDYWLVPARTAIADVVWPRDSAGEPLHRGRPHGVAHACANLAIVASSGGRCTVDRLPDQFPSLTTLTAGDVGLRRHHVRASRAPTTVQEAIDRLCQEHDLRRHHRLLHGWGIVCGLAGPLRPERAAPAPPGHRAPRHGDRLRRATTSISPRTRRSI